MKTKLFIFILVGFFVLPIQTFALVHYDDNNFYTMQSPKIKKAMEQMTLEQTKQNVILSPSERAKKEVDVVLFVGQSNMVGQGYDTEKQISSILFSGFEMRFNSLNQASGIKYLKNSDNLSNSLVPAFANAYYNNTGIPIIAIDSAKSGSKIIEWQPGEVLFENAKKRLIETIQYVKSNPQSFQLRNVYLVWYQGETDSPTLEYEKLLANFFQEMKKVGIQQTFLIRIGHLYKATGTSDDVTQRNNFNKYTEMIKLQTEFTQKSDLAILISTKAALLSLVKGPATIHLDKKKVSDMMNDQVHFSQLGLDIIGSEAGKNAAEYTNTKVAPEMIDYEYKRGRNDFFYTGYRYSPSLTQQQSSSFYQKSRNFINDGNKKNILQYGILSKQKSYNLQLVNYNNEFFNGLRVIVMNPFQKGNYIGLDCSGFSSFMYHYAFGLPFDYSPNNIANTPWTTAQYLEHPQSLKYGSNQVIDMFKYVGELKSASPQYTLYSALENFTLRTGDIIIGKNNATDAHAVVYMGIVNSNKKHLVMNSTSVPEHNLSVDGKRYPIGFAYLTEDNFDGAQNFSHTYKTITVLRLNNGILPDNFIQNQYVADFDHLTTEKKSYQFIPEFVPDTIVPTNYSWTQNISY